LLDRLDVELANISLCGQILRNLALERLDVLGVEVVFEPLLVLVHLPEVDDSRVEDVDGT